jgi:hypothetical protein
LGIGARAGRPGGAGRKGIPNKGGIAGMISGKGGKVKALEKTPSEENCAQSILQRKMNEMIRN